MRRKSWCSSWSSPRWTAMPGEHEDGFVGNPGADDAERQQPEDGEVSVVGQESGDMGSELGHAVSLSSEDYRLLLSRGSYSSHAAGGGKQALQPDGIGFGK